MADIPRRSALIGAALATAGAFLSGLSPAHASPPLRELRTRAVVIGAGLAGAITAYRLAEAGVQTLVLERGRRWAVSPAGNTFATTRAVDKRVFYAAGSPPLPGVDLPIEPYPGILEILPGDGMAVVCGAGVGGGTLVYAGATIRPREAAFGEMLPTVDWRTMDAEYYPRAARRLQATPVPDDVLAHPNWTGVRAFMKMGEDAGMRPERVLQTVDWNIVRQELAGERVPALSIGEYLLGVNSGARNSVDKTYLAQAERTGKVSVAPLHRVLDIGFDARTSRFTLTVEQVSETGAVLAHVRVVADAVFCSAGSVGTSKLLVAARETGTLVNLNEEIGRHWGGNGDEGWANLLTSSPIGVMQGGGISAAIRDDTNPARPTVLENVGLPVPLEMHVMGMLCMSVCPPAGEFRYHAATGDVTPFWPAGVEAADRAATRNLARTVGAGPNTSGAELSVAIDRAIRAIADQPGMSTQARGLMHLLTGAPTRSVNVGPLAPFTGHPLGGATLNTACDNFGRVDGYRGLYVTDAALIPGSTGGCNPTWTIAALAERCLDTIVQQDVGVVF
ncbi:FAD-dependent oxidoreductase [Aldersonia kunmingensis]|uniref:FAD-dependent oxidoreductase n=1 Tax=Aldersonia kunmingensis TaxID=408066 RepID=UPI000834A2D5|nr:FAD-dependent oxidoreductase [Aldersonia kunmingensis]